MLGNSGHRNTDSPSRTPLAPRRCRSRRGCCRFLAEQSPKFRCRKQEIWAGRRGGVAAATGEEKEEEVTWGRCGWWPAWFVESLVSLCWLSRHSSLFFGSKSIHHLTSSHYFLFFIFIYVCMYVIPRFWDLYIYILFVLKLKFLILNYKNNYNNSEL